MNGIGTKGAHRAPPSEGVQDVHADLTDMTQDASSGLNDTAATPAEPAAVSGGNLGASVMLLVLTLALVGASAACLAVVGLGLAVWLPALIATAAEGEIASRAPLLAGMLAAPLVVFLLVRSAWSAFARARAGRCADLMLAALVGALALHAFLLGV